MSRVTIEEYVAARIEAARVRAPPDFDVYAFSLRVFYVDDDPRRPCVWFGSIRSFRLRRRLIGLLIRLRRVGILRSGRRTTFTVLGGSGEVKRLVVQFVTKQNTVRQLQRKLAEIAGADERKGSQQLAVFVNYVNAKTNKDGLTQSEALILIDLATGLVS